MNEYQEFKGATVDDAISEASIAFAVPSTDLVYEIVDSKISVICAHTNLDKAELGVSYLLAKKLIYTNL